jgi:hypothetical protein
MELKAIKTCTYTFQITLSDTEARYLIEQHSDRGSEYFSINHSFCSDSRCVSCRIVKGVKEQLDAK